MALDNQTMYLRQRIIQERMQTNCNKHNNYLGNGWNVILITITKTCLYNFDPLKPHFYIVKLGFTGVDIIFLISAQNIDCEYSLELPRRGGSNEYPQSMFLSRNKKNNVYPCKPQFYYIKVGFKGVKII